MLKLIRYVLAFMLALTLAGGIARAADRTIYVGAPPQDIQALITTALTDTYDWNTSSSAPGITPFNPAVDRLIVRIDAPTSVTWTFANQKITLDKCIYLDGNSNTRVILEGNGTDPVITIAGNGLNASRPIQIADLQIQPKGKYAINVTANSQYFSMSGVKVIGNIPFNNIENEVGIKVATGVTFTDVALSNCYFENLDYGFYFAKAMTPIPSTDVVSNMTVTSCFFKNNGFKGIYVEKLSNTIFNSCTVESNGSGSFWNQVWNAGFDINLKNGDYSDITIKNTTFKNNGNGFKEAAALMIKARDEGSYITSPAHLNTVLVDNCTFEGNERGIRFGEPRSDSYVPNSASLTGVTVRACDFKTLNKAYTGTDAVSAYGFIINYTPNDIMANGNYWFANNIEDNVFDIADNSIYGDVITNLALGSSINKLYVWGDYTGSIESGTQTEPFKSIANAFAAIRAISSSAPVELYVRACTTAVYNEAVELNANVDIIGGWPEVDETMPIIWANTAYDWSNSSTGSGKPFIFKALANDFTIKNLKLMVPGGYDGFQVFEDSKSGSVWNEANNSRSNIKLFNVVFEACTSGVSNGIYIGKKGTMINLDLISCEFVNLENGLKAEQHNNTYYFDDVEVNGSEFIGCNKAFNVEKLSDATFVNAHFENNTYGIYTDLKFEPTSTNYDYENYKINNCVFNQNAFAITLGNQEPGATLDKVDIYSCNFNLNAQVLNTVGTSAPTNVVLHYCTITTPSSTPVAVVVSTESYINNSISNPSPEFSTNWIDARWNDWFTEGNPAERDANSGTDYSQYVMVYSTGDVTPRDEVWVATNGNDTWPGTYSQPVKTILRGVDIARPGGVVKVKSGEYYDYGVVLYKPVTLKAAPASKPIMNGMGYPEQTKDEEPLAAYRNAGIKIAANNVTVEGLEITRYRKGIISTNEYAYTNVKIKNNYIHTTTGHELKATSISKEGYPADGIHIGWLSEEMFGLSETENVAWLDWKGLIIENNKITDVWRGIGLHSVKPSSGNIIVKGNEIYDALSYGIMIASSQNIEIANNNIYENLMAGINMCSPMDNKTLSAPLKYTQITTDGEYSPKNINIHNNTLRQNGSYTLRVNNANIVINAAWPSTLTIINNNIIIDDQFGFEHKQKGIDEPACNDKLLRKGLFNRTNGVVVAEYNWWGHASGPSFFWMLNPGEDVKVLKDYKGLSSLYFDGGLGASVSQNVDFSPYYSNSEKTTTDWIKVNQYYCGTTNSTGQTRSTNLSYFDHLDNAMMAAQNGDVIEIIPATSECNTGDLGYCTRKSGATQVPQKKGAYLPFTITKSVSILANSNYIMANSTNPNDLIGDNEAHAMIRDANFVINATVGGQQYGQMENTGNIYAVNSWFFEDGICNTEITDLNQLENSVYDATDNNEVGEFIFTGILDIPEGAIYWLEPTIHNGLIQNAPINLWNDLGEADKDAYQTVNYKMPLFNLDGPNERPGVKFTPVPNWLTSRSSAIASDFDARITSEAAVATGQEKVVYVVFEPNNTGYNWEQMIFEAGGQISGFNFFIQNNSLVIGAWNKTEKVYFSKPLIDLNNPEDAIPDNAYIAYLKFFQANDENPDTQDPWYVTVGCNGWEQEIPIPFKGLMKDDPTKYTASIGVGCAANGTKFPSYNFHAKDHKYFDGTISNVLIYNSLYQHDQVLCKLDNRYAMNIEPWVLGCMEEEPIGSPKQAEWKVYREVENIAADNSIAAYPNPTSNISSFDYNVNDNSYVEVEVLNELGEQVMSIHKGFMNKGSYNFAIDGTNLASGTYTIKVSANGDVTFGKLVIVK